MTAPGLMTPDCMTAVVSNRGILRPALPTEFDDIYALGRDVWGEGISEVEYLQLCRGSIKYKSGQWYLFERADGRIASAVITYFLAPVLEKTTLGVGSLATHPELRKNGFASEALAALLAGYSRQFSVEQFFLFAEINLHFYEKLGFIALPPALQAYQDSVCMLRAPAHHMPQILQSVKEQPVRHF